MFEAEDGRIAINQEEYNLPMKSPVLVITRADKTSLYPLRDIAYSKYKAQRGADKNIIVLVEDQKLYFNQVAAALDIINVQAPEAVSYTHLDVYKRQLLLILFQITIYYLRLQNMILIS